MDVKSLWLKFGISLLAILIMTTSVFSEEEKEVTSGRGEGDGFSYYRGQHGG